MRALWLCFVPAIVVGQTPPQEPKDCSESVELELRVTLDPESVAVPAYVVRYRVGNSATPVRSSISQAVKAMLTRLLVCKPLLAQLPETGELTLFRMDIAKPGVRQLQEVEEWGGARRSPRRGRARTPVEWVWARLWERNLCPTSSGCINLSISSRNRKWQRQRATSSSCFHTKPPSIRRCSRASTKLVRTPPPASHTPTC